MDCQKCISCCVGNSSQVSDGAAAVLMARRSEAARRGLRVFGVVRGYAVVGCPPDIMGIGPAVAIPELLKKTGITYPCILLKNLFHDRSI